MTVIIGYFIIDHKRTFKDNLNFHLKI